MRTAREEATRARVYLARVAEPPAPAVAWLVAAVGPVEAAARVREGRVSEDVARETSARRGVDNVDADLAAARACGGRLLTPEDDGWPHWAFAALENAALGGIGPHTWFSTDRGPAIGTAEVDVPVGRGAAAPSVGEIPAGVVGEGAAVVAGAEHASAGLRRGALVVVPDGPVGPLGPAIAARDAAPRTAAPSAAQSPEGDHGAVGRDLDEPGRRGRTGAGIGPARGDLAPPLALWVLGPGHLADLCERSAALVGARAATSYGLHVASDLGAGLAAADFTVVSGAAIGVDGAAHRGALAVDGPTIAVLACGVDRSYPAAHETLLSRVAATGLVVSEYPPGSVPARHRFLVRNRLIAGLAGGTVVVEAGLRSGSQRTAADARALGRPVMAVPGPVTSGMSAGCHRLVRDGAVLVTRVEEVLEEVGRIGVHLADELVGASARPTDGLSPEAALVHDALPTRGAKGIAWLAMEAGLPPSRARAALEELLRRELVEHVAGRWQRTAAEPG